MNNEVITIQDCLDMYEKKNRVAVLQSGQVVAFRREEKKKSSPEPPFQSEPITNYYQCIIARNQEENKMTEVSVY
ncbi:hypothetical protein [Anaerocolumna sp.]|uniref:hypothetical protein n=1 Tax=Anaerocolumna sp. TaxID=2041569 RepID=UPI0028AF087B|nr:hypothetical protein [Anaerocolumna sp.]